jgi:hypothetical protein
MNVQVSICTDPLCSGRYRLTEPIKASLRYFRDIVRPPPRYSRSKYRGHFAVTRSMVEGLRKIGVRTTYNPRKRSELAPVVIVPSGYAALKQAIDWKRSGKIRRLLAGPNLVDFPSEQRELLCAPQVDTLLVPGDWFRDNFINDCSELNGKVIPWPAGVDTRFWAPEMSVSTKSVLVYEKQNKWATTPVPDFLPQIERRGYRVRMIAYGKYSAEEYLSALRDCCLMVGFSTDESQGLAWAEAWSTDVPTLLWNQESVTYKRRTYRTSSAPYLSSQTGLFFTSVQTFHEAFDRWESTRAEFRPRDWVLEHMSDEVCARALCKLAQVTVPNL